MRVSEERKETLSLCAGINPKNFQNQNDEITLLRIDNVESKQIIQSDTKKREILKNSTKIEEIQEKKNY